MTERLGEVLSRFESLLQVDDEKSAEYDRVVKEAQEVERRERRAKRLESETLELDATAHRAIVSGTGLRETRSLLAVQRWLWRDDVPPVLVLVGNTGCGKSVAAAWALANGPESFVWRNVEDVVRSFAGYFDEQLADQKRMKLCRLLVLDDIATELDATRVGAAVLELMKHRLMRKTIITTNLAMAAWKMRYSDPRLHSRLDKSAVFVTDTGPDLRGAK